ncbi:LptF/LptG family permease [Blastopirellula sp. JC732]|uniref:LptF/LptG family permease n=1 Tax=Blastopirellula sediminis TaxID=2894196 RepID=A0A9X1SLU3_9BACT|nr:LptF/LptG family permease [Blastopirellula sediminis]MCC9605636.1 LptF/LptG family permease [Blastopirellula sediminis]MCC9631064.1 LptF/LptG family permease [Blastopirellula sediminis]
MRIITRYILWEILKIFFMALGALTLLIVLVGVVQQALREGLGPGPIARIIPYMIPDALRFSIPGTILFASCSVYGRLASGNELAALKAAGVSPLAAIWPAYAIALFLSIACVWLNDVGMSWGNQGVRRVLVQSFEEIAYGMLRTHKSFSSDKLSILVREVDGRRLMRPQIVSAATPTSPQLLISAAEAELHSDENDRLIITLIDSRIESDGASQGAFEHPGRLDHIISLDDETSPEYRSPSKIATSRIPEVLEEERQIIKSQEDADLAWSSFSQLVFLDTDQRAPRLNTPYINSQINRLRTEPWRRWANGFSCLFFVLVGVPLAIKQRNPDFVTSFFMTFLPVLLVFYPLLAFAVDRAKDGALPPQAVWFGNVVLLAVSLYYLRTVWRY